MNDTQLLLLVLGTTATRARNTADRLEVGTVSTQQAVEHLRDIGETLLELRATLKETSNAAPR